MNWNNLKGTLYDLLGYFAPGIIAIISGCFVGFRFNEEEYIEIIKNLSALEVFIVIVLAYILGHAIATLSSWIIEKRLMEKNNKLRKFTDTKEILGNEHYITLCKKYTRIFNAQYNRKDIRKIICYVQSKESSVYETAQIFLAFYGMARNLALVFALFSLVEIGLLLGLCGIGKIYILLMYLVLCIVFLFEYIRFRKYFTDTILSGFLIPEKDDYKEDK